MWPFLTIQCFILLNYPSPYINFPLQYFCNVMSIGDSFPLKYGCIFKQLSVKLCCNQCGGKKRRPKQRKYMFSRPFLCLSVNLHLFMISSSNGRHEDCTSFTGNASVPLGCLVTPAATDRRRRRRKGTVYDPLKRLCTPGSGGPEDQLHGEALKWDEAQTWNCCHCDCFFHVVSQSVLVHGLAKWQRWVHLWESFSYAVSHVQECCCS